MSPLPLSMMHATPGERSHCWYTPYRASTWAGAGPGREAARGACVRAPACTPGPLALLATAARGAHGGTHHAGVQRVERLGSVKHGDAHLVLHAVQHLRPAVDQRSWIGLG